jgi:hypothetical protein
MKKVCRQCGVEQRMADYYRHPNMGDGHLNVCKSCVRANVRANYQRNREHYQEYERGRANLPHRVEARDAYQQTPAGKVAARRAHRRFIERNPIKRQAQVMVGNALRDGRLARQPCEVCCNAKAHAHHDDYSKPLDVRWLCTTHHAEWHKHNTPKCPQQEIAA